MNFKKLSITIVICAMILAACSGGDDKKEVLKYDEVTSSTIGSDSGKDPEKGIGFDGKTISLGVITPKSGNAGFLGNAIQGGNQTYWDAKNKSGGVAGKYKVEIIDFDSSKDGTYDKALSLTGYDELTSKVVAFQQVLGTDVVLSLKDRQLKDTKLVFPSTLSGRWTRDPLVVPVANAYQSQAINGVGYYLKNTVREEPKICSLALDDSYGDDSTAGVEFATKKYDVEYTSQQKFTTGASVSSQVDALVAANCNMVVYAGTAIDVKTALEAFATKGKDIDVYGLAPAWIPQVDLNLTSSTKEYAKGHFYVVSAGAKWGDTSVPGMSKMLTDISNFKPNQSSNPFFMFGYVQAWAMDQILEVAVANGDLSPAGVSKALSNVDTFDFEGLLPSYVYGPNTNTRIVPAENTVFIYTTSDPSKLTPAGDEAVDYASEFTSKFAYKK